MKITDEMLAASMKSAVATGLVLKHLESDTYIKTWGAMKQALESALEIASTESNHHEKRVRETIGTLTVERVPYAWEVTQGGRKFLLSAEEFTGKSYDCATFKPLYQD